MNLLAKFTDELCHLEAATDSLEVVSAKIKTMSNNTAAVHHQGLNENGKNEFIHRVKILNLPPHEINSTKRLLQSHGIYKFKKAPKWEYAFLNCEVSDTSRSIIKFSNSTNSKLLRLRKLQD